MEDEDIVKQPASSNSAHVRQNCSPSGSSYEATEADFLPLDSDVRDMTHLEASGTICNDPCRSVFEPIDIDSQSLKSDGKEEIKRQNPETISENPCESGSAADLLPLHYETKDEIGGASGAISDGRSDNIETPLTTDTGKNEDNDTTRLPINFESTESVSSIEKNTTSIRTGHAENGSVAVQSEGSFSYPKQNGDLFNFQKIEASPVSGVKRPRVSLDCEQPSVHIIYKSLTRESKRKLEELLQQWSQWHVLQNSPSSKGSDIVLESGEETYFPAIRVGLEKPAAVSFWVDEQTRIQSNKDFTKLDGSSVPLYDRGYSLALTSADGSTALDGVLEKLDSSRCFNCGSYSHALKDCTKPRDNVAVNNARKQHRSKRNQHANSRNATRYYQSPLGGKFDGLTPGVLNQETRKALGLGELDPPPWLTRMREIGYPPGYLEPDEVDRPSGITIFGDETNQAESEEGEILDASYSKPSLKKSVEFPGINAPIPENADERLWATGSSSFSLYREHSHRRFEHSSEYQSRVREHSSEYQSRVHESEYPRRVHESEYPSRVYESEYLSRLHEHSSEYHNRSHYREPRFSRDFDDDGPPGCDPGTSPSLSYHYRKYAEYDSSYTSASPLASPSTPWSATFGRSLSDRGRRSPLLYGSYPNYGRYGNYPHSPPR